LILSHFLSYNYYIIIIDIFSVHFAPNSPSSAADYPLEAASALVLLIIKTRAE